MSLIDESEQPLALPVWKRLVATFFSKDNLNSLIYFASSLFGAMLGFFTLPYFTHFMPKAEIGLYGYALAVNTFILPILLLSVESFYLRTVYSEQDESSKRVLLGSLVLFVFIWSVLLVGLLLLFGPLLFHAAGIRIPFYPTIALILTSNILSVFTVFALLNFRIKGQAWYYFALTAFQNVAITGTSLLLIYFYSRDAFGRILGTTVGTLAIGCVSFFILFRKLSVHINWSLVQQAIRFSLPLIPYVFATLLFDLVDRFFLERYSSLAELAVYAISFQYASIALMVSIALFKSYEPELFRLTVNGDFTNVVRKMNLFNVINFLCSVGLLFLADFTINLLTHGLYKDSVPIAQWLIVALFIKSAFMNLNTILTALGKNVFLMLTSLTGLCVVIVASVYLVSTYQGIGTAYIKLGLYSLMFLGSFFFFVRRLSFLFYLIGTACLVGLLIGSIYLSEAIF